MPTSPSPPAPLCSYQGTTQNFAGSRANVGGKRDSRERGGAGAGLLIPSTMPEENIVHFGEQVPMRRPAQPRELAPVYVLLASDEASYISGANGGGDRRQTRHLVSYRHRPL